MSVKSIDPTVPLKPFSRVENDESKLGLLVENLPNTSEKFI